jgi:hypothetical protein
MINSQSKNLVAELDQFVSLSSVAIHLGIPGELDVDSLE